MTITELIKELRELEGKATRGEWHLHTETEAGIDDEVIGLMAWIPEIERSLHDHEWSDSEDWDRDIANGELIVTVRNSLPRLLDALEVAVEALREIDTEEKWQASDGDWRNMDIVTYPRHIAREALRRIEEGR